VALCHLGCAWPWLQSALVFEIGNSLRDARLRKGLELSELEVETKIRARYLRALEEEQFHLLPGDSYVKGFLRTYADRLELDGQLYVDEYNSRFSLRDEPAPAARGRRRGKRRSESHAVVVALVGILAVTVLVIAAWRFGSSEEEPVPQPPAVAETLPDPGDVAPEPVAPAEPAAGQQPVTVLAHAARGSSHLEVRQDSAFGKLVWEGTLENGQSQPFTGVELWIMVEVPANLDFELDPGESGRPERRSFTSKKPILVTVSVDGIERVPAP
jgi:cytoskeleton protein RodZ